MENFNKLVEEHVEWISSIGADPTGGTTRLLYDENWRVAQNGLKDKFETQGLVTNFDEIGNLYGKLSGSKYPNETILTGSHVDTVVNGGKLDGQFGIIASYLAVKYLKETHGAPLRNLEIVSMAEEEGSRFPYAFWGSKNIWGLADKNDVIDSQDANGIKFVDAMKESGFDFRSETMPVRDDVKAFVEIHIEQGSVLEKTGKQVGVVNNIVGQKRYTITLTGESNHAGTTPMGFRKDTVYAMSKMISQATDLAYEVGDPLVLTFGHVEVQPNTVNVVPGHVTFSMDCRHTDKNELAEFTQKIEKLFSEIATAHEVEIEIDNWMNEVPVPMSSAVVKTLEEACQEAKLNYTVMHSGAGHDSQIFAPQVPTAMIFVPSIGGISHNPAEDTKTEDLVEGLKALIASLYKLAYEE
ncbi:MULTISPECIES: allantoate deiminase [Vagococcus]|uniref:Allantoate amidohydrolase n=1 Tax=Vagococcus fluvialis bH819 TaxID=1255619 RepID=A0A1X6WQW2_9ENTE|nr:MULTISPECIES: allantoate deiminase [Vagococcus]SLM86632.1 Allantoate amidohydrolase [Vagococcus fluvialis bH819]HCM90840.1 allantoate amidohydrolase [Vagococcus sp.]